MKQKKFLIMSQKKYMNKKNGQKEKNREIYRKF